MRGTSQAGTKTYSSPVINQGGKLKCGTAVLQVATPRQLSTANVSTWPFPRQQLLSVLHKAETLKKKKRKTFF